jgi:membrane-bound metal-dependent hydrolase YbcI (DUF457 family)
MADQEQKEQAIMIAGHFGFAALVKGKERSTPLWILMLASVWLDIVFVPLFAAGLETIQVVPGLHGYGAAIIHADYTHSLVGMLVLSALLGAICWPFWGRRSAIIIGLVAASHWFLDLIVHRYDMPILPENLLNLPRLGFGLWRFPALSIILELALVLVGAWVYWIAAKDVSNQAGRKTRLATISALLIVISGAVVLWMDASS